MNIKINLFIIVLFGEILFSDSAPSPPLIPVVEVVSNHEKIKLTWNIDAENSIDPFTGYADFEGYRI